MKQLAFILIVLFTLSCRSGRTPGQPFQIANSIISELNCEVKRTVNDTWMDFQSTDHYLSLKHNYTIESFRADVWLAIKQYNNITTEEHWQYDGDTHTRMYYVDNAYFLRISFTPQTNSAAISYTYE